MDVSSSSRPALEVKRSGRLSFVKKRGVRRPALRELFRPVLTTAEVRLFFELYTKYSGRSSTNWANMCYEWNQRAALALTQISGADKAIHQKNIPLLKRYEKELVTGIIKKDSLNLLQAHSHSSVQPFTFIPSTAATSFGAHPTPLPTFQQNHPFALPQYSTSFGPPMVSTLQPLPPQAL